MPGDPNLGKHEPHVGAWQGGAEKGGIYNPDGSINMAGVGGAAEGFFGALTGDGEDPGQLGLAQYRSGAGLDPTAFSLPGYEGWQNKLANYAKISGNRQGLMNGSQAQVRAQQAQLSQMLMDQANGVGPSLAQAQLQQASDQNMRQALSLGASQASGQRGAGALRQVGNQRAQIGQQQAADSGVLRLQEQMQARGMLGQHQAAMRGQDQAVARDQQSMNDEQTRFYTQAGLSTDKAQMDAKIRQQELLMQQEKQKMDAYNQTAARRSSFLQSIFSFGLSNIGGGGGGGGGA